MKSKTKVQKEIFKTIPNYPNYEVSNLGNVKSLIFNKEKILKPTNNLRGYLFINLTNNIGIKARKIHQLVAEAFLNHTPCGMKLVINHINHNKIDNRLSNLEVVTHRENSNKKHLKSSSKYTGVHFYKPTNKWMAQIRINKKQVFLGYHEIEIDASNAYQKALLNLSTL